MTAQAARGFVSVASLALVVAVSGCTNFYETPIETPIQPKLDVSGFQRVLVAGFIVGGTDDVDANVETVRLLRSQLRSKSSMRVIDAEILPLAELALRNTETTAPLDGNGNQQAEVQRASLIKDEKELESMEHIFANVEFWKKVGEEFQSPLIVTGTVFFTPHQRASYVQQEREVYDQLGRRRVVPTRTYQERRGFILRPRFVFIDGATGTTMYTETFREEILYNPQQNTPALSSYFELMDRLIPHFLMTLSSQKIRGTRVLLK
jgi:hypothetical protein